MVICGPCIDAKIAGYLLHQYAAGRVAAVVFPNGPLCRIAVMTLEPDLFAGAVQRAVEVGAPVEHVAAWDRCLAVTVRVDRALTVARLLSSTAGGSRRFGVV